MIRRTVELESGQQQFWLIAQHDHAILSGQFAAAFGNQLYAPPTRGQQTTLGVAMHDAGWPLHDDAPELNEQGLPADVFETTVERGVKVWEASAARAEAGDAYAGLLVSIHVQRLAARYEQSLSKLGNRERFWLIRFRNDQAQRQMRLRKALGLSVERPLDHGLALTSDVGAQVDAAEQNLSYDVRLLQAMDMLSLCICCTQAPTRQIGPLLRRPGGATLPLRVDRITPWRVLVHPWPFAPPLMRAIVPYREVPGRRYGSEQELHEVLSRAARQSLEVTLEPRRGRGL